MQTRLVYDAIKPCLQAIRLLLKMTIDRQWNTMIRRTHVKVMSLKLISYLKSFLKSAGIIVSNSIFSPVIGCVKHKR